MENNTCFIIAGPTASGKTALAIELAQYFNTEIISADSRQCFRELTIGSAKPSSEQLSLVPHHFVNSHSIHDMVTAATFESYALQKAAEIFSSHRQLILVGGTGLYIKAFCEGLDAIPAIDPSIRQEIRAQFEKNGIAWLQEMMAQEDVEYFQTGEIKNPQRLMRALEVVRSTGKSIRRWQRRLRLDRPFNIVQIGLDLPMEELQRNIRHRTDQMMQEGLLREVESLYSYRHLNALQTVGYKELFDYLDNLCSLDEAVEQIKINTRRYAKRQLTWFRKIKEMQWFHPSQKEAIISYCMERIRQGYKA